MASIFTRIINGEIPSYKVAEDENYYAFLDIHPLAEGHTWLFPKRRQIIFSTSKIKNTRGCSYLPSR